MWCEYSEYLAKKILQSYKSILVIDNKNVESVFDDLVNDLNTALTELNEIISYSENNNNLIFSCQDAKKQFWMVFSDLLNETKRISERDPAVTCIEEVILCYPYIEAIILHRIAHFLYTNRAYILARILSEKAHSFTGIDIHPGAKIGKNLFIDHGTGIVIGETCKIGNNVTLYQGVTLGTYSFKNIGELEFQKKRHPTIEDNVTIYANATVLGGNTIIGKDSIIGSNAWIASSIEANSTVKANSIVMLGHSIKENMP